MIKREEIERILELEKELGDIQEIYSSYKVLVDNLKGLLYVHGISHQTVGDQIGITKSNVGRKLKNPNAWKFEEMERVLQLIVKTKQSKS